MKHLFEHIMSLEKRDKIMFFLIFTTIGNIVIAIVKLSLGIFSQSIWFGINAGFTMVLSLARFSSIRDYTKVKLSQDKNESLELATKNYIGNGLLLIILGIIYFILSVYMYYNGTNTNMHEYLTYLVALISFWSFGTAIYGMIKYRKDHTLIIKAVKITNFAYALTSIVLTQVTLLDTFSDSYYSSNLNGYTGMGVSLIIIGLGLYMVISRNKITKESLL